MFCVSKFVVLAYLWSFNLINSPLLLDSIDNYLIIFFNGCISPLIIWVKLSSFDINLVKLLINLLRDNYFLIYFKFTEFLTFIFRSFWLNPLVLNMTVELFICWELYSFFVSSYSSIFLSSTLNLMKELLYFNTTFLGRTIGYSGLLLLISIDYVYGVSSNQFPYFFTGLMIYALLISWERVFMCSFYRVAGFCILFMKQGTCLK